MASKNKRSAPDEQVFTIPFQGVMLEIKRGDPLYKKLAAEAEKQVENQFLEERIAKLDKVKAFISESFTSDDFMALNGFAIYVHFNAQRFTDNGCIKSSALKVYARIPKVKEGTIVITDAESEDNEPEGTDVP